MLADTHDGVQGRQRVLEDHRDFVAAQTIEVVFANLQQILTVIEDFAALDDGIACEDAQNRLAGDRLAGTGFTDDRQRFALVQVKADVTDSLHLAARGAEGYAQIAHLQLLFFLFHVTQHLSKTG